MAKIDLSVLETGYHRLLRAIFGYAYKVVFKNVEELISAIQKGTLPIPIDSEARGRISAMFSYLTEREVDIIKRRFGIERGREKQREIAESYDVSSSAIWQAERKATIKLMHLAKSRNLSNIAITWQNLGDRAVSLDVRIEKKDAQVEQMEKKLFDLKCRADLVTSRGREAAELLRFLLEGDEEDELYKRIVLLNKPVSELDLSLRAANALEAADITTVRELVVRSENDMLKLRNFGRKSLNELKVIVAEMGLAFEMVVPED